MHHSEKQKLFSRDTVRAVVRNDMLLNRDMIVLKKSQSIKQKKFGVETPNQNLPFKLCQTFR